MVVPPFDKVFEKTVQFFSRSANPLNDAFRIHQKDGGQAILPGRVVEPVAEGVFSRIGGYGECGDPGILSEEPFQIGSAFFGDPHDLQSSAGPNIVDSADFLHPQPAG